MGVYWVLEGLCALARAEGGPRARVRVPSCSQNFPLQVRPFILLFEYCIMWTHSGLIDFFKEDSEDRVVVA